MSAQLFVFSPAYFSFASLGIMSGTYMHREDLAVVHGIELRHGAIEDALLDLPRGSIGLLGRH
jgi:hypothetical protein